MDTSYRFTGFAPPPDEPQATATVPSALRAPRNATLTDAFGSERRRTVTASTGPAARPRALLMPAPSGI